MYERCELKPTTQEPRPHCKKWQATQNQTSNNNMCQPHLHRFQFLSTFYSYVLIMKTSTVYKPRVNLNLSLSRSQHITTMNYCLYYECKILFSDLTYYTYTANSSPEKKIKPNTHCSCAKPRAIRMMPFHKYIIMF